MNNLSRREVIKSPEKVVACPRHCPIDEILQEWKNMDKREIKKTPT
jgi:hypothetical protein